LTSRALRNAREPILDAVDGDAPAAPAYLRREHRTVVLIIEKQPRDEPRTILRPKMLYCGTHGRRIAGRLS